MLLECCIFKVLHFQQQNESWRLLVHLGKSQKWLRLLIASTFDYLTKLFNCFIKGGAIPEGWHLSFIINLFKGKRDALFWENYRDLKLQKQVINIFAHFLDAIICQEVSMDNMQLDFIKVCHHWCHLYTCSLKIPDQEKKHIFPFPGPKQGLWSSSFYCIMVGHVETGSIVYPFYFDSIFPST